jgi:putative hemolysin
VGEIEDEFDAGEVLIQKLDARRWLINGKTSLVSVNEQCGLNLEADGVETIAGWLIAQLGSLPKDGERIQAGKIRALARKVVKNRVREILLEVEE